MRKLLIVAEMRSLEKQVHLGEISYSRMIEIINEKADTLLSDKLLLAYCEIDELTKEVEHKNHTIENDAIHIETLTKEVERLRKEGLEFEKLGEWKQELKRRHQIILTEPSGLVRETMINDFLIHIID